MAWITNEVGDQLYDEFAPLRAMYGEMSHLQTYLRALGLVMQPVFDLSKDGGNTAAGPNEPEETGWSQALDLDRAQDGWLRWLGQWVGYFAPQQPTSWATERQQIRTHSAHRRGTIAMMREDVQEHLNAPKDVIIQERTTTVGTIHVWIYDDQIATSAALAEEAARSQKAAGLLLNFTVLSGQDYALLQASNTDYAEVNSVHSNYNSVLTNPGL